MEIILGTILSYITGLAVNYRTDAIVTRREAKLKEQLAREDDLRKALASSRTLRDELRASCIELARNTYRLGVTQQEMPLWNLLSNDNFQNDLTEWLMAGGIAEGDAVKARLLQAMEKALTKTNVSSEQITFLRNSYFDALEKTLFAHPILAHWRHQLSLDYLREQVVLLRRHAEEAAGLYSLDKQNATLNRYCEKALETWDIIDLSNLPEGDIHMATQQLLLRQLYMPLRISVEGEGDDALDQLEEQREFHRHREAGHFLADESEHLIRAKHRAPVGERLATSRRLVVLGDPGGGKTTMLRWMATAYLLRIKGDTAFSQIPDAETLPEQPWIPVLIRCRDLGRDDLCRCFKDFLTQHLNKTKLLPDEADVMLAVILDGLAKGKVLLLIDGLDEITDPQVRMIFCQELEHTAARYPDAPIVVTSRIVGYRDMPYRISSGFEHSVIAELDRNDKDLFAHRWIEVTEQKQSTDEKAKRVEELLEALHSSNRIERLTGNPMLLTTLALVKRKVGKLPNKRTKLYAEAVAVLLNWNPRLYETIEEDEAIPQLEYLAYEMCRRGVQRLTDDEVLDLLDKLRSEYPNIRAVRRRDAQAFLGHLEARSSILIKSGGVWQKSEAKEKPVWEFRHLTFQEYLAARALLDGRFPDREKTKSLAEQVAPLAGEMETTKGRYVVAAQEDEIDVPESWREALRLLVAECKDDDVDDVLLAIMNPLVGEDAVKTARPRAVLAALCLADEPNISEQTAQRVIDTLTSVVGSADGEMYGPTTVDKAAIEIGASMWSPMFKLCLVNAYCHRAPEERAHPGALLATLEGTERNRLDLEPPAIFNVLVQRLRSVDRGDAISAALGVMQAAFERKAINADGLIDSLFVLIEEGGAGCTAAAWALVWLSGAWGIRHKALWLPSEAELDTLAAVLGGASQNESDLKRYLIPIFGMTPGHKSLTALLSRLDDQNSDVCQSVIGALGSLGDKQAIEPLLTKLNDQDVDIRMAAIDALGQLGGKQAVVPILTKLDDQDSGIRIAAIEALARLGDKQAVAPLLGKMDDQDANLCRVAIEALGKLGDKQAVAPLLAKLDAKDSDTRVTVIRVLGQLGDKQAVAPLLAKLGSQDSGTRVTVIQALGKLGDKQALEPLILMLEDLDPRVGVAAAVALTALEAEQGPDALKAFLKSDDSPDTRVAAVRELVEMRDKPNERILLSRDFDGAYPWIDPSSPITETHIAAAAETLGVSAQEARSLYESIAADFCLKLT